MKKFFIAFGFAFFLFPVSVFAFGFNSHFVNGLKASVIQDRPIFTKLTKPSTSTNETILTTEQKKEQEKLFQENLKKQKENMQNLATRMLDQKISDKTLPVNEILKKFAQPKEKIIETPVTTQNSTETIAPVLNTHEVVNPAQEKKSQEEKSFEKSVDGNTLSVEQEAKIKDIKFRIENLKKSSEEIKTLLQKLAEKQKLFADEFSKIAQDLQSTDNKGIDPAILKMLLQELKNSQAESSGEILQSQSFPSVFSGIQEKKIFKQGESFLQNFQKSLKK